MSSQARTRTQAIKALFERVEHMEGQCWNALKYYQQLEDNLAYLHVELDKLITAEELNEGSKATRGSRRGVQADADARVNVADDGGERGQSERRTGVGTLDSDGGSRGFKYLWSAAGIDRYAREDASGVTIVNQPSDVPAAGSSDNG